MPTRTSRSHRGRPLQGRVQGLRLRRVLRLWSPGSLHDVRGQQPHQQLERHGAVRQGSLCVQVCDRHGRAEPGGRHELGAGGRALRRAGLRGGRRRVARLGRTVLLPGGQAEPDALRPASAVYRRCDGSDAAAERAISGVPTFLSRVLKIPTHPHFPPGGGSRPPLDPPNTSSTGPARLRRLAAAPLRHHRRAYAVQSHRRAEACLPPADVPSCVALLAERPRAASPRRRPRCGTPRASSSPASQHIHLIVAISLRPSGRLAGGRRCA